MERFIVLPSQSYSRTSVPLYRPTRELEHRHHLAHCLNRKQFIVFVVYTLKLLRLFVHISLQRLLRNLVWISVPAHLSSLGRHHMLNRENRALDLHGFNALYSNIGVSPMAYMPLSPSQIWWLPCTEVLESSFLR